YHAPIVNGATIPCPCSVSKTQTIDDEEGVRGRIVATTIRGGGGAHRHRRRKRCGRGAGASRPRPHPGCEPADCRRPAARARPLRPVLPSDRKSTRLNP